MTKRIVNIPGEFTYWENWCIAKREGGKVIVKHLIKATSEKWQTIKESDPAKHLERIAKEDFKYICGLLKESPYHLEDPHLKRILPVIEMELSLKAPFDREAKRHLQRLHAAKVGDSKGKRKDTERKREIIERDTDLFRRITRRHEKTGQTIEESIAYYLEEEHLDIEKSQVYAIYKAYRRLADDLLDPKVFNNDLTAFFDFLNIAKERIDKHSDIVNCGDYVLIKGEVAGRTFRASL